MRVATILVLTLFILPLVQANSESSWSHEFDAGYISTQPLVVDDSVYVRTSGFWTGEERPLVAAFELQTGNEIWRYTSQTSLQHDMAPLLFVESGSGTCGAWNDLLLVGWTDGKLTALSPIDGSLVWQNQTEVDIIGITGKMVLEDDQVIVPTRTGLSSFCLADGAQLFDIDTENIGWRNGVAIIEDGYVYGDENGYLHEVNRNGNVTSTFLDDGKIRHAPLDTRHGLFVHIQTAQGSTIYLNGTVLANMGNSPAIPLSHNNRIYAATSDEWISLICDEQSCTVDSVVPFRSNGELSIRIVESEIEIWAPSNTPVGGWGVFNQTSLLRMETTIFDTYGTAAPGFAHGVIALGNDAGILSVGFQSDSVPPQEVTETDVVGLLHLIAVLGLFLLTCFVFALRDWQQFAKIGSAFLLVLAIAVVPNLSVKLAEQTSPDRDVEWDASWPDEWKGTQVIVFEIDETEHVIGGLEQQDSVYELTLLACEYLGISTEIEQQYLGAYLVSFNETVGDGWEFTIDGSRSSVGMVDAKLSEASIVEWRPA
ncbi:MAG: PQQ-binding-like beta-propeller repeat protein [Candidatus Thermoplasmatota archaeon]|nr:PQQ-binding-like beta-propeller repeat protein [Candidatus Thermoplasmatota archaeon]